MIGKNFIYNGVQIPYSEAQGRAAGWIADVEWSTVTSESSQIDRQDFHGIIPFPTVARNRLITVRGEIFHIDKIQRGVIRKTIQNLFVVKGFPAEEDEFETLQFTDDDNTTWFINAKVFRMAEFENERANPIIEFNAELLAKDVFFQSTTLQTINGIYGRLTGITLPTVLPIALSNVINEFPGTNNGNFPAGMLVKITGEITNPKILNTTTGKFYGVGVTMVANDILLINFDNVTNQLQVTLNGVNVRSQRLPGSNLVFMNPGLNNLVLLGSNFDINNQNKALVEVQFRDTRI